MAYQSIYLPAARWVLFDLGGGRFSYRWNWDTRADAPEIDSRFGSPRYLWQVVSANSATPDRHFITLNLSDSSGANVNSDLSDAFETDGALRVTVSGVQYTFSMNGADLFDPYILEFDGAGTDAALLFSAISSATDAILELSDDGVFPSVRVGSALARKIYIGSTEVTAAYVGATKVHVT